MLQPPGAPSAECHQNLSIFSLVVPPAYSVIAGSYRLLILRCRYLPMTQSCSTDATVRPVCACPPGQTDRAAGRGQGGMCRTARADFWPAHTDRMPAGLEVAGQVRCTCAKVPSSNAASAGRDSRCWRCGRVRTHKLQGWPYGHHIEHKRSRAREMIDGAFPVVRLPVLLRQNPEEPSPHRS